MDKKLKIVYIEDLRIVREAVNFLLSHQPNIEVITEEPDPERIPEFLSRNHPDIVIIDLQLANPDDSEGKNGFTLCERFANFDPKVKLIAHSMYDSVEYANRFFASGGHAFVSKKSGHTELLNAIEAVSNGKRYVCVHMSKAVKNISRFISGEESVLKAVHELFTKTEKNVLERIAKGFSTKQIAHQMGVSEKTVETHRKHLFDKAGVKNVAELIAFVFSRRIVME